MLQYLHVSQWVASVGYVGLFLIVFIETGLFFGFFLPGDSLVVTAGFLASQGYFDVGILVCVFIVSAILGYAVAYWLGRYFSEWLLRRRDSLFFKKRYLQEAKLFYEKHGPLALVVGRLLPIVRTFVPIAAGLAGMPSRRYMLWNVIGGLLWGGGLCLLGYALGELIPNAEHYILPCVIAIIILSLLPACWHLYKHR